MKDKHITKLLAFIVMAIIIAFLLLSSCCIIEDICYSLEYPEGTEYNPTFTNDTVYYAYDNFIELVFEYKEWCLTDSIETSKVTNGYFLFEDKKYPIVETNKYPRTPTFEGFIEWYIDNKK
jgi:hypothetical protein